MDPKTIYQAMVAIDGIRSYVYVRADNMSQAFDCALLRANARNPQSYVEVVAAQELREPVDANHTATLYIDTAGGELRARVFACLGEITFSTPIFPRIVVN
jgi:hypothetical protein